MCWVVFKCRGGPLAKGDVGGFTGFSLSEVWACPTLVAEPPIISYIALRARCASCGVRISPRYVVLEFLCGVLWAALIFRFGVGWDVLLWFWIASCCVAIVSLDLNHWWIPDLLVLQIAVAGCLMPLASGVGDWAGVAMGVVPALCLWAFVTVYGKLRGIEVMGFGDIKLFAAFGLVLGWQLS